MGYSLTIAIRVCSAQPGSYFWDSDLNRGIIFKRFYRKGYNIFQMQESFKILSAILTVERGIKKIVYFFLERDITSVANPF